ncbi:MAG: DUF1365 domain-containing protein, partial [Planctomycetes bacterium]|nr:DUF1365 domain-containing protein [Planctomycetota bacterium]
MKSCLYKGRVEHRRFAPKSHEFWYRVTQLFLDLGELDQVFEKRWFWSTRRFSLAWFRRRDHLGDPGQPLDESVRDLVQERCAWRPNGPIRLLTYPRYFGYVMNPVSFYYCRDEDDERTLAIVAEVNNTPWGERHCYVFDCASSCGTEELFRFRFPKDFHVSPFMGMNQSYDWSFSDCDERLFVHMENIEDGRVVFDSTTMLQRRPITARSLAWTLLRHPHLTAKVVLAIYWQAFRLWLKRVPFHEHPRQGGTLEHP